MCDKITYEIEKVVKKRLENQEVLDQSVKNLGGGTKMFKVK